MGRFTVSMTIGKPKKPSIFYFYFTEGLQTHQFICILAKWPLSPRRPKAHTTPPSYVCMYTATRTKEVHKAAAPVTTRLLACSVLDTCGHRALRSRDGNYAGRVTRCSRSSRVVTVRDGHELAREGRREGCNWKWGRSLSTL